MSIAVDPDIDPCDPWDDEPSGDFDEDAWAHDREQQLLAGWGD